MQLAKIQVRGRRLGMISEMLACGTHERPQLSELPKENLSFPECCSRKMIQHHQRSEEHTSELQSPCNLVCRLLLEKKKTKRGTDQSQCFPKFSRSFHLVSAPTWRSRF